MGYSLMTFAEMKKIIYDFLFRSGSCCAAERIALQHRSSVATRLDCCCFNRPQVAVLVAGTQKLTLRYPQRRPYDKEAMTNRYATRSRRWPCLSGLNGTWPNNARDPLFFFFFCFFGGFRETFSAWTLSTAPLYRWPRGLL